jgi:hypothetical protein
MMKRKLIRGALIHCAVLLVLAAACLIARPALAGTQQSQREAERFAGESGQRFMQFTCFFTRDNLKNLEGIYELRQKYLEAFASADLETPEGGSLFNDAWSTTGSLKVYSEHGNATTSVVAVGGNFFDFHPLPLRSGSYLRQEDLNKDRVVLDEILAWMLFGSPDVAGMEVSINERPYVIAGVVVREDDKASQKFAADGPMLYIPFESWLSMHANAGVDCYEVVLAEPVNGFTQTVLEQNFPVGNGVLQQNTERYTLGASVQMMKAFGTRGARESAAILPYWENAARYVEDWCTLLAFLAFLLLIFPAVCAIAAFVWGWILARRVLRKYLPRFFRWVGDFFYALSSKLRRRKGERE